MRLLLAAVAALVILTTTRAAHAERDLIVPFHESGHLVLDQLSGLRVNGAGFGYAGPAGIAFLTQKSDALVAGGASSETSLTSLWLAPSADMFVTDHLSVGGRIEIGHTWGAVTAPGGQRLELPGATSMSFMPRVGFYVPVTDRIGVWPRAAFGWSSVETASYVSTGSPVVRETFRSLALDVDLSVIYRFGETFFMKAGPEVGVTLGGRRTEESNGVSSGAGKSVLQLSGTIGFGVNLEL